MNILLRWALCLKLEHRVIGLIALRKEIDFVERWLQMARAHIDEREQEIVRLRRDLEAARALQAIERSPR